MGVVAVEVVNVGAGAPGQAIEVNTAVVTQICLLIFSLLVFFSVVYLLSLGVRNSEVLL